MSFFDKLAKHLELDDFDKRDKTAFIILGCAMLLVIVLWFWQLQRNITNPLYGGQDPNQIKKSIEAESAAKLAAEAEQKTKDTDGDGLTDWDEINVYKTSPYLADTDSDGINDLDEIKKGTDPNCPEGKDCNGASNQNTSNSLDNQGLTNLLDQVGVSPTTTPQIISPTSKTQTSGGLTDEEKNALKQVLGSSNDPAILRNFLLASGADKAYVDSLKDEDLQKVINEILK